MGYTNFEEYRNNNWNTFNVNVEDSLYYLNNKIETIKAYFNGFLVALFSNNLLPFPISIIAFIIFIFSFRGFKKITSIVFLQPAIYFPLLFAGISSGTIAAIEFRDAIFFKNIYSLSPHLFSTFIPVLLFSLAFLFNKLNDLFKRFEGSKNFNDNFNLNKMNRLFLIFNNKKTFILIAVFLAIINGILLKGIFEVNPENPVSERQWISDKSSNKIFKGLVSKKKRKLKVLTTCDFIPILIDKGEYIEILSVASSQINISSKNNGLEFLILCNENIIKRKKGDIILYDNQNYDISKSFDLLYTTEDMMSFFSISEDFKIIKLKFDRILVVNNS